MLAVWPLVIAADALAGLGDIRLKDVVLQMTTRHFPLRVLALHYVRMCVIDRDYEEISKMAKSIRRELAEYLLTNMALAKRHRLPLMLFWAAGIEGLSCIRSNKVVSTLQSGFDVSDVPAVLPVIPLLPPAIQTAFKNALREALDDQDEDAFDYLYKQLIDRETTRKKEAAERQCLEAEIQRLREENATVKEQERRGTKRPRDEMEGQQQQRQQQEGEADQEMKS